MPNGSMESLPESSEPSPELQKKYWSMVQEIKDALFTSFSRTRILELRDRWQDSYDDTTNVFGRCLSEVDKRGFSQEAREDAYRAAEGTFNAWKEDPTRYELGLTERRNKMQRLAKKEKK